MTRDEVIALQRRADALGATIAALRELVTTDHESKQSFIEAVRKVLGDDPDDRVAAIEARVRKECAALCDAVETDKFALYKGRSPYTGQEPGRADAYTNGESDGAGQCATAIRAAMQTQAPTGPDSFGGDDDHMACVHGNRSRRTQ